MNRLLILLLIFPFSLQIGISQLRFDVGISINTDYSYRFLRGTDLGASINRLEDRKGEATKRNMGIGGHASLLFGEKLKVTMGVRYADLGFSTTKDNAEFWHNQRFTDIDVYRAYYEHKSMLISVLVEKITPLGKTTNISYGGGVNHGFIYKRTIWQTGETFIDGTESSRITGHGRGISNQNDITFRRIRAYYIPALVATGSIHQQIFKRWSVFSRISYSLSLRGLDDPLFRENLYFTSLETGIRFNFSAK